MIEKELVLASMPESPGVPLRPYPLEREASINDFLHLLARRRGMVVATVLLCFAIAVLYCVFSTRRYEATAQVQVQNQQEQTSALGLDGVGSQQASYSDSMEDNLTIQTESDILTSDTLALKVIADLNLQATKDFQPTFDLVGWAASFITPDGPPDPPNASWQNSPRRRDQLLSVFTKHLTVKPVAGTRLINISYLDSDPALAAQIVNHLTKGLADYNFQIQHDATAQTADWLAGQLADLRKQSEDLQAKVAQAQHDSGVLTLGGVDAQGREQLYSTVLDKLQQATADYTKSESDRIAKGAVYQAAKTGDAEAISGLSGSGLATGNTGLDNALSLVQSLRVQLTTVKAQLADLSAKFGPAYPKLAELRSEQQAIEDSIDTENKRLVERAKNDYTVAQQVENQSHRLFLMKKQEADSLNDKTIQYTIVRQEADESRTLYETLFKQLKQAGVLADFHSNNISVVDPARAPAKPAKPRVLLSLLASIAAGLFFGCCAAVIKDKTDSKIQSLPELEYELGATTLGILPLHKEKRSQIAEPNRRALSSNMGKAYLGQKVPVIRSTYDGAIGDAVPSAKAGSTHNYLPREGNQVLAIKNPHSPYIEALRALRTSLLLSRSGSPPQVILVTSSVAAEGKSMLSINLAMLFSQQGKRVLLVDGDLRRPSIHRALRLTNTRGLSTYLAGQAESETSEPASNLFEMAEMPGLFVIPAGPTPPYPSELLGSEQMRNGLEAWRKDFDFIIVDGAPVLPVTDSVVLSTMVDFVLLVARYKLTERQSLDRSHRLLQAQINRQKIGIVLNAVSRDASTYYHYYGYKNSAYFSKGEANHEVA